MTRRGRRAATSLAVVALGVLLAWQGAHHWRSRWYASLLPPSIEVQQALFIDSSGAVREGCGVAVYEL